MEQMSTFIKPRLTGIPFLPYLRLASSEVPPLVVFMVVSVKVARRLKLYYTKSKIINFSSFSFVLLRQNKLTPFEHTKVYVSTFHQQNEKIVKSHKQTMKL